MNSLLKNSLFSLRKSISILILIISYLILSAFLLQDKKLNKVNLYETDTYILKGNRFQLPFSNNGKLADINVGNSPAYALFDGKSVLFSGGFLLGGYIYTNTYLEKVFVNGVYTSRRIEDYIPGKIGMDKNDPKTKIYIVQSSDPPFSKSWQEWKTAVELGADFYDGDNDGIYNPLDKNNNGQWDLDEDRPNLIGDFTAWCIYNDGVPKNNRQFMIDPLGIEIQQTIWFYNYISSLNNSVFVRYRIIFKGNELHPNLSKLDSVVFSFVNDFDIGNYLDDLVGTDTLINSIYGYNEDSDDEFSYNPPAIFSQLLQGPQAYIPNVTFIDNNNNGVFDQGDTPISSANLFIDPLYQKKIDGAKNLGLNSTNILTSYSGEINEYGFWNILNGYNLFGKKNDPCQFFLGVVVGGVNCNDVNPKFIFSGDPVNMKGWINDSPFDINTFLNTERFTLEKDKPVDIIVTLTVGRGTNALNSITEGRKLCKFNKLFYEKNFYQNVPLPIAELKSRTFENRVDLIWETREDFNFNNQLVISETDTVLNLQFERYELWVHKTPELYFGNDTTRSRMLAAYDVENDVDNIYITDRDGISIKNVFSKGIQLPKAKYSNPTTGIIIYSLDKNPFTGKSLTKGEKLFFTLRKIFLNRTSIDLSPISNNPKNFIINSSYEFAVREKLSSIKEVTVGEDFNQPLFLDQQSVAGIQNTTESRVVFEEVDKSKLTDDLYQISFSKDLNTSNYLLYWRLKNQTKNIILLDSQYIYYNKDNSLFVVDGLFPKIEWIEPEIKSIKYQPESNKWFKDFKPNFTGAFYMGSEPIKNEYGLNIQPLLSLGTRKSSLTKFDQMRKIEIRFGQLQYAYRFVSNTLGTRYFSGSQTAGSSGVGQPGAYFIEVPFQVWIKDERYKEERQLACAFLETRLTGGKPDGVWDPDTNITNTKEYIVIFNQTYDPQGKQMEYVGYLPVTGIKTYAELNGWDPPVEANFTPEQIERAKSPWFDALLVIGLEKSSSDASFKSGDVLTIPISYVITERDTFYYQSKSTSNKLSAEQKKNLISKINVFPNPYFEWEDQRTYGSGVITFSNLPEEVTIKIYTLSGILVRTLNENNKSTFESPFVSWDLKNEDGKRVADGVYLAHIKTKYGEKVLKFSIVKLKH